MAGYYHYSMSNNAVEAYDSGQKPMSKWTKKAIFEALASYDVKSEHFELFKAMTVDQLRSTLLTYCGWHHTSKYFNRTDFYQVEYDEDGDYLEAVDTCDIVYKIDNWWLLDYNRRRRAFRNVTNKDFAIAKEKHKSRQHYEWKPPTRLEEFKRTINYFSSIPYIYDGDGYDDFNKYQRPSSNGIGYVAICPGYSGNNFYTDNVYAVKALKRKYTAWRKGNPDVEQIPDEELREAMAARKRRYDILK
jgi:hypothetical protein